MRDSQPAAGNATAVKSLESSSNLLSSVDSVFPVLFFFIYYCFGCIGRCVCVCVFYGRAPVNNIPTQFPGTIKGASSATQHRGDKQSQLRKTAAQTNISVPEHTLNTSASCLVPASTPIMQLCAVSTSSWNYFMLKDAQEFHTKIVVISSEKLGKID